jgi:hypothetical protein
MKQFGPFRISYLDHRDPDTLERPRRFANATIEFDPVAIVDYLGPKAGRNRSKVAREIGGLLRVKVIDL